MLKLKSANTKLRPVPNPAEQVPAPWKKKETERSEQILITVAGVEPKVGATHLALSLAIKAHQRNINCALIVSHETFEALRQYYLLSVKEEPSFSSSGTQERGGRCDEVRQFANFSGLSIMSGVLPGDLEGYQLLIWDCGSLPAAQRRFLRGNLRCLVSGGQPWELAPLISLLDSMNYAEMLNYVVCIRGASDPDFEHIKSQMAGKLPCIKTFHKTDWSDVKLREDLVAILRLVGK